MYFSAYRQKIQCIFSDSIKTILDQKILDQKILDQNNSVGSGDYRESPNEKKSKNFSSKPLTQFSKKNSNLI